MESLESFLNKKIHPFMLSSLKDGRNIIIISRDDDYKQVNCETMTEDRFKTYKPIKGTTVVIALKMSYKNKDIELDGVEIDDNQK